MNQTLAAWLIKKVQRFGPHKVRVMGHTFRFSEDVFNPAFYFTSRFMARNLELRPEDTVLDMGTGSGVLAVIAARVADRVVAVDLNPEAVNYARLNAMANGVEERVTVLQGDLFAALERDERFDVILFNPPYLEGQPVRPIDHALFDPGHRLLDRFLAGAHHHLKPDGYVQILYSSIAGLQTFVSKVEKADWQASLVAEEKTITERFRIYRLTKKT
jgi:release factor glutamine methyltransferase